MASIGALLWIIITLPFRILGWLLKHKLALVVIVVAVVAIVAFRSFNQGEAPTEAPILPYQTITPDATTAPVVIETTSRVYYVVSYTDDGEVITLTDWFDYDTEGWERRGTPLIIDRAVYGDVRITER